MKSHLSIFISMLTATGFFACGGGSSSSDEMQTDMPASEVPAGAAGFVSSSILASLESKGLPVHLGSNPPSIDGTFRFADPTILQNDSVNWPAGSSFCEYDYTFTSGGNEQVAVSTDGVTCNAASDGLAYFISGDAQCFSLFGELSGTFQECENTTVQIISACVTADGHLENLFIGSYGSAVADTDACDELVALGSKRAEGESAVITFPNGALRQ